MHCYDAETGEARHTVPTKPGAKNSMRPTTIADLRKNPWYPSVTTIISDIASPDLENWRINEHIKAAWDIPVIHEETFEGWSRLVRERATNGTTDAADFGTQVHAYLEQKMLGHEMSAPLEVREAAMPVLAYVESIGLFSTETEQVTVNRAIGYAGTVDVSAWMNDMETFSDIPLTIDYKTKKTKKQESITVPETYPWQLAAYHVSKFGPGQRELHPLARACNIFISSTEPGRFEPVWYTREQLEEGWEAFKLCHRLYCIRNKWKPKIAQ